jgi:2-phosphosulfolactate phosphatase
MQPVSSDQRESSVCLDWGAEGIRNLQTRPVVIVVVDVLSFCTTVSAAVDQGIRILPFPSADSTVLSFARAHGALVAGKRGSELPSLSPTSLSAVEAGQRVVLPSPNGAQCSLQAATAGATVIAGSLRNAGAVARTIFGCESVTVIAAGERRPGGSLRPAVEDLIGAGAILSHLPQTDLSPESRAAVGAFDAIADDLSGHLLRCVSGRELVAKGFAHDVAFAAQINTSRSVPVLRDGAFENLEFGL